ncbi:hypothetical protein [Streptomyces sp. NBC_00670]|jgi:hypothetical protein|uniref:hypothetical protein n=1 Tax=Streptomyces sp. NBC_00670 TaxID=2975804 RepID=UPI002E320ECE|nr:hypothetical protein [Streptomyces sp. NBC_00670]
MAEVFGPADVRPLVKADLTDSQIAVRLGMRRRTVTTIREALELAQPRERGETLGRRFARQTVSVPGGHLLWRGPRTQDLTPVLSHRGKNLTARRVAYSLERGHLAVGLVLSTCVYRWCVAGGHLADGLDRCSTVDIAAQLDAAAASLGAN